MTNEQSRWLKANPAFRPIGVVGGLIYYTQRGTLHADGRYVAFSPQTPVVAENGSFGVGVPTSRANPGDQQQQGWQGQAAMGSVKVVEPS